MSQVSSQIYDPNLVSIPFAKFSHNTSPYGTRNFIWNHIGQRDDLDMIIRNNRVIDEQGNYITRVILKIIAGVDVLETQDLGELVNFNREFDPSSGAEHPVQVVIRCPFMAMKYPKTINTVRRIQLKFNKEDDFKNALNILKDLGFPITESGPNAASVSRQSIPSAKLPLSSIPTQKPLVSGLLPSSDRPSISEFKVPTRPDTRNSETTRAGSAQSFNALFDRPVSTSTTFSAPTPPSSVSAISPLYDVRNHASLLYPIQHEESEISSSYPAVPTTTPSNSTQSRFYQSCDQHQHQSQESFNRIHNANSLLIASPLFSTRPTEEPSNLPPIDVGRLPEPFGQSEGPGCARPAPNVSERTNISQDLLPPKRELPFPKRRDGDRRSSPKPDLPPLPMPTPVLKADFPENNTQNNTQNNTVPENKNKGASTPTPNPAKKRVAQRKPAVKKPPEAKLPTQQQPATSAVINSNTDKEAITLEDEVSPLAAKSNAARPPSATSGLQTKTTATKKRPTPARPSSSTKKSKMVDQCTQTQTLSGRNHTTASVTILQNENSASTAIVQSPTPLPQDYSDLLETFMKRQRSGPAPKELWERSGYSEGGEEQRQAILNDFICENLENPEFLQLCEDTDKAWRRIGLGM